MSIDPVCGIEMDKELGVDYTYKGNVYYFCSEGCKRIFIKKPRKYAK
ncbi:MAG TPA: YHS domain-containing protein [Nitrososphaeraceae archaeon]|nr:YHS domain-containing protein [Nitrososphaeraceae archaeon]